MKQSRVYKRLRTSAALASFIKLSEKAFRNWVVEEKIVYF